MAVVVVDAHLIVAAKKKVVQHMQAEHGLKRKLPGL